MIPSVVSFGLLFWFVTLNISVLILGLAFSCRTSDVLTFMLCNDYSSPAINIVLDILICSFQGTIITAKVLISFWQLVDINISKRLCQHFFINIQWR